MDRTNPSRWVDAREASALLQGYMPSKLASDWLNNDRKFDPAIPFKYMHGDVCYRTIDLEYFVKQCLAPRAKVDFSERRRRSDRRNRIDRRNNPPIRLIAVAERRSAHEGDRRAMQANDRRAV